jgi:hypothetical protein
MGISPKPAASANLTEVPRRLPGRHAIILEIVQAAAPTCSWRRRLQLKATAGTRSPFGAGFCAVRH